MENVNNKQSIISVVETNNGKVVTNRNKQNNIKKVYKKIPDKKPKDNRALITAHSGIENLRLRETTPKTPRETLKKLWDKGIKYIEEVSFYVKGYLEDSDNKMVTVENVCSTKLLTYHCNLIVKDNPDIINYFGKVVTFDIEIYPYPENPDKFSFNIIGEPIYYEVPEYYNSVFFNPQIERQFVYDTNQYISSMVKASKEFKIRYINDIITEMNYLSKLIYGNEHLISNLILNTLMVSLDVDDRIIYENEIFINKYFYDIIMIYVKIYLDIAKKNIRLYKDLIDEVMLVIGIYTDSPYIHKGEFTAEFLRVSVYLNISNKQCRFYYGLFDLSDKPKYSLEERQTIIEEMKQLIVDYSYII